MQIKKISSLTMLILSIFLSSIFSFSIGANHTQAQVIPDIEGLIMEPSIQNPKPGQVITITAKDYSINLENSTEVWKVDGIEKNRGIGITSINITAPSLGKHTTVSLAVVTIDGNVTSNTISIGSGSVDLITENSGYVPPFFLGKTRTVYENSTKIVAVPHIIDSTGKEANPANLIYEWYDSGYKNSNWSGYGKQSINIPGSTIPNTLSIRVRVSTRDGLYVAEDSTVVSYQSPLVKLYRNDPLYGPLFNKELSGKTFNSDKNELGILAVPFGFDKPINNIGDLFLKWTIDGTVRDNLSANESIITRSPEGTFGTSDISIGVDNSQKILQTANGSFSVSFKKTSTNNNQNQLSF